MCKRRVVIVVELTRGRELDVRSCTVVHLNSVLKSSLPKIRNMVVVPCLLLQATFAASTFNEHSMLQGMLVKVVK